MSVKPRTIDDLGIQTSTKYAQDKAIYEKTFLEPSREVSMQTLVDVSKPAFVSEYDSLFETSRRNSTWARFRAPDRYFTQKKRLFTHQVLPSIGSEDLQTAHSQKILSAIDRRKKRWERKREEGNYGWEDKQEEEEEKKESDTLIYLLEYIHKLDRDIIYVTSRRNQYQRG